MLLILLLGALAFLWMLDAFFTMQVLEKKGDGKEANRLMRGMYRRGVTAFVAFKIIVMLFVLAALLLASDFYPITAESAALIFIYIYASVDWHNYKIWRNRNKGTRDALISHVRPKRKRI